MSARGKVCIFCGLDGPFHKEDILPKWVVRLFPKKTWIKVSSMSRSGHFVTRGNLGLTTRAVCKACNNGWMSRLETSCAPFLKPMALGQPVVLSSNDQIMLVRWITKTVMVLEFSRDAIPVFFETLDRLDFYASFKLPANKSFTIAHWAPQFFDIKTRSHDIVGKLPEGLGDYRAFITTIAIGGLILQLFCVRNIGSPELGLVGVPQFALPPIWADADIQIPRAESVRFPPRLTIPDSEFDTFANRWRDFRWFFPT